MPLFILIYCFQVGTDPHKLASVVASSLVSATLAWCFLKIGPNQYSSLFATCPKDSQVCSINEDEEVSD